MSFYCQLKRKSSYQINNIIKNCDNCVELGLKSFPIVKFCDHISFQMCGIQHVVCCHKPKQTTSQNEKDRPKHESFNPHKTNRNCCSAVKYERGCAQIENRHELVTFSQAKLIESSNRNEGCKQNKMKCP